MSKIYVGFSDYETISFVESMRRCLFITCYVIGVLNFREKMEKTKETWCVAHFAGQKRGCYVATPSLIICMTSTENAPRDLSAVSQ